MMTYTITTDRQTARYESLDEARRVAQAILDATGIIVGIEQFSDTHTALCALNGPIRNPDHDCADTPKVRTFA